MIIPIKCFTCGGVLADKYQCYLRRVRELKMADMGDSREINQHVYLTKDATEKTAEGIVMDQLGLYKVCCRRHMLTHVDI